MSEILWLSSDKTLHKFEWQKSGFVASEVCVPDREALDWSTTTIPRRITEWLKLADQQGTKYTQLQLRLLRRMHPDPEYVLSTNDKEARMGIIESFERRASEASFYPPPLPRDAQPNDYQKIGAVMIDVFRSTQYGNRGYWRGENNEEITEVKISREKTKILRSAFKLRYYDLELLIAVVRQRHPTPVRPRTHVVPGSWIAIQDLRSEAAFMLTRTYFGQLHNEVLAEVY